MPDDNHDSETADSERELETLRALAETITTDDYIREEPPVDIWREIASQSGTGGVTTLASRRMSANRILSIAAALVLVGAAGFGLTRILVSEPTPDVAAEVQLVNTGLPVATTATAAAELLLSDDGYELDIDLSAIPDPGDALLEIWIIDTEVEGMFSLGTVDGDGRFELPPGIDPADFPIVDISVEPIDGDPTHSGQSVLRGILEL